MIDIVTGASGFIGSKLCQKLNHPLVLEHQDIITPESYDGDNLFYLATYGNMAHHNDHYGMIKANVWDVIHAVSYFKGWFCYMSSSSVLLPVQTPYSRTKRAAEEILQALPELKSCIVRPYSVTGVGEQKEHLIPTLIRSCMEGEEMPFDPNPVHDFVDVEDICDALIYCADSQITGIFEFGNGVPYTNQEVRTLVEFHCDKKANIKIEKSLRSYDNEEWFCRKLPLWFAPIKSLPQSISEMVEAYKHERS